MEVRKELDTILKMVSAWRADYERFVTPDGGNEFLISDFAGEIEEHIYPYLRRMRECEYITTEEMGTFFDACYGHVNEFARAIEGRKNEQGNSAR